MSKSECGNAIDKGIAEWKTEEVEMLRENGRRQKTSMRRNFVARIFFVLALVLAIFASGTGAQARERISKASPALTGKVGRLIVQRTPNFGTHLSIRMSIDGKKVANIGRNQHYGGVLSAGRHVVTVLALPNTEARRPTSMALTIKAGQVYIFTATWDSDRLVLQPSNFYMPTARVP